MIYIKNTLYSIIFIFALFSFSQAGIAAEKCTFTGDLTTGSIGEEVRCLQKYLNASGFMIAESGAGSPGKETDSYGSKTRESVIEWQVAKGIMPATGTFGALSRAAYGSETAATSKPSPVAPPGYVLIPNSPTASVTPTPTVSPTPSPAPISNSNSEEKRIKALIKSVREMIEEAEDDIDDAKDDGEDVTDPENMLKRAEDKLIESIFEFIDGDYAEASLLVNKARNYVQDSVEDISGNKEEAEESIEDAKEAMADAKEEIRDAKDDDEDVDEAEDLYDEAKDLYNEAKDAFDDEDYNEAKDLAEKAIDLFDDAIDAL